MRPSAISHHLSGTRVSRQLRGAWATGVLLAAALVAGACKDVTVPNYNNPSLEQLTGNPTAGTVNTALVGMLINLRGRVNTEAQSMGILGKESYNLDQAEPRNVLAYLQGPIEPGGFVQDLSWTAGYRNLQQGAVILVATDKVAAFKVFGSAAGLP